MDAGACPSSLDLDAACAICYCTWCWIDTVIGAGGAAWAVAGGFWGWMSDRHGGANAPGEYYPAVGGRYHGSKGKAYDYFRKGFGPRDPGSFNRRGYQSGPGRTYYIARGLQEISSHYLGDDPRGAAPGGSSNSPKTKFGTPSR